VRVPSIPVRTVASSADHDVVGEVLPSVVLAHAKFELLPACIASFKGLRVIHEAEAPLVEWKRGGNVAGRARERSVPPNVQVKRLAESQSA